MQIKPPKGNFCFDKPSNSRLRLAHAVDNLWKKFEVINLQTNHRQGEDRIYAELLNRIRTGEQENEDIDLLKTRVVKANDTMIPEEALVISGTNAVVNRVNEEKLAKLKGEKVEIVAKVFSESRGEFKPKLDNKNDVLGTPLQYKLKLIIGCRVMLTYNLDVCDSLVNGSQGKVAGFEYNREGELTRVLVKFDEIESGRNNRNQLSNPKYKNECTTPIELMEFNYSLSQSRHSKGASSVATVLQFPIRLAYGATAHKIQGHTVRKPSCLVVDLVTWLQPAMAYVMLSRIQCLDQLFIIDSVPENKIKPWQEAINELERLNSISLNRRETDNNSLKVTSLNVSSLNKHFDDLIGDQQLTSSDIICIQETWLAKTFNNTNLYSLNNYNCHFNSIDKGKGIVTYYCNKFEFEEDVSHANYQITKVGNSELSIINIYRSHNARVDFVEALQNLIDFTKTDILCGDFNFCYDRETNHPIKKKLTEFGFVQKVSKPTHQEGRLIDQVYILSSIADKQA